MSSRKLSYCASGNDHATISTMPQMIAASTRWLAHGTRFLIETAVE